MKKLFYDTLILPISYFALYRAGKPNPYFSRDGDAVTTTDLKESD